MTIRKRVKYQAEFNRSSIAGFRAILFGLGGISVIIVTFIKYGFVNGSGYDAILDKTLNMGIFIFLGMLLLAVSAYSLLIYFKYRKSGRNIRS